MKPEDLLHPISAEAPAGIDCVYVAEFQSISDLTDYLFLRAEIEELRRNAKQSFDGENAASDRTMAELALKSAEDRSRMQALRVKEILGKEAEPSRVASAIESRCIAMLTTTGKDLRVAHPLTVACLKLRGLSGLLEGLAVFEGLLRSFPEAVHPMPDEDDSLDDSTRAMVLSEMVGSSGSLAMLRETVLVSSRAGRLSFRDAEVLDGVLAADPQGSSLGGSEHLLGVIRAHLAEAAGQPAAMVSDADVRDRLRSLHLELLAAEETIRRIGESFRHKAGGQARMAQLLTRMGALIGKHVDDLDAGSGQGGVEQFLKGPGADYSAPPAPRSTPAPAPHSAGASAQVAAPRLATREDARRQILELAVFLEKLEPSHPAPLFLRRAARLLAAKSFFEIVGDMMPDSTSQVETLTGQKVPEGADSGR